MKTILVDAVDTFVIEGQGIFEPLHNLLEQYQNKKILVTNANDEEMVEFGLDDVPYEVFTLKHQPNKTDPVFFKTFLTNSNLKPSDVVYFEHNPDAVKSAQSVGITAYHYNEKTQDLVALKTFLDKNL